MQAKSLSIVTTVDGNQTQFSAPCTLEKQLDGVRVVYTVDGAQTTVFATQGRAEIVRAGDYGMHLCLSAGGCLSGTLEIAGSVGEVTGKTHQVDCVFKGNALMILLRYDMQFGSDVQKMQVRMMVK